LIEKDGSRKYLHLLCFFTLLYNKFTKKISQKIAA
jgi:hypothetical protein